MSTITYKKGAEEYSFESKIQLKNIPLIAAEENLFEEIREEIRRHTNAEGNVHDICIVDDSGIIATAKDSSINGLNIIKNEED